MFALILSLCINAAHCNDYIIDSSPSEADCHSMLVKRSDSFAVAWGDEYANRELTKWLKPYNIIEPIERVTDYDFTCPFIPETDIP
jgi:hypothetical protein